jgi:uncharacterized protein (DUF362 family)
MSIDPKNREMHSHRTAKSHGCPHGKHGVWSRLDRWTRNHPRAAWMFPLAGFLSLVWFLIRVLPKPSRAAYPCQRVAAPLAGGFLASLAGLVGPALAFHKPGRAKLRMRRFLPVAGLVAAVVILLGTFVITQTNQAQPFSPSEALNSPMGTAKGINPGRVVWIRDAEATSWDGSTGNWWDDANTDQKVVDAMMAKSLLGLTGVKTDKDAWDALFKHFNRTRGQGETGYKPGEKIVIKINANQDRSPVWGTGRRPLNGLPSPHAVYALVSQLITAGGVPGGDITIYEAAQGRNIGEPVYKRIRSNPDPNFQAVNFVVNTDYGLGGRIALVPDLDNPIKFAKAEIPAAFLPTCVTGAKYMINMALLRAHGMFGVTLTAKNHFGSTYFPDNGGWTPRPLHSYGMRTNPMGSYNCLVDLVGHKHLGGKTLLFMLDGLYTAEHNEGNVYRFQSFGDDWASSLFMSQDPMAIDSVGLDFLRSEPRATQVQGNADNFLHEGSQANKPPSGIIYDPEGDGTALESLGVHEHWNNATDRKYSRNLGTGKGIELVIVK